MFDVYKVAMQSRTRLFINLSSIVRFPKQRRQGVPYKAEN